MFQNFPTSIAITFSLLSIQVEAHIIHLQLSAMQLCRKLLCLCNGRSFVCITVEAKKMMRLTQIKADLKP